MVKNIFSERILKLQNSLSMGQSILLSRNSDVFYFSSFINSVPEERSVFLLIAKETSYLFLQNFLPKPADFPGKIFFGTSSNKLNEHLTQLQNELGLHEIFLDFENLNIEEFRSISRINTLKINALDKKHIWSIRTKKDATEIKKIKIANKITDQAIAETIKELTIGQTELEVKRILENKIRQHADCDLAFPSIIAFDQNTTLPHHQSGNKKLQNGYVVLIDAGAKYQEYCADMTRTIFFAKKDITNSNQQEIKQKEQEFNQILGIVKTAYQKAKALLAQPKIVAADLDLACRNYITEQGYGKNFIHTTGHGLGIDIHEQPSIYRTNLTEIVKGMVITIEPGIYLEGKFGVRWENTVFV